MKYIYFCYWINFSVLISSIFVNYILCFHNHNKYHKTIGINGFRKGKKISIQTKLNLDIFGLGPAEVLVIVGAAALLYGPDRIKGQLRDSGVKGSIVSAGWKADRAERINELRKYAIEKRRKRMLKILNDAVELGDSTVITKLSEYEENSS